MAVRPIDAEKYMGLLKEQYLHNKSMNHGEAAKAWQGAMQLLYDMPTLTQPNEPLTLEQLREMDGEPVWVQTPGIPKYGRWVIVAGVDTEDGQRTLYCQGDYTCRNYGRDWLAYRRPPEGEED